jgi:hypothetical protein
MIRCLGVISESDPTLTPSQTSALSKTDEGSEVSVDPRRTLNVPFVTVTSCVSDQSVCVPVDELYRLKRMLLVPVTGAPALSFSLPW